MDSHELLDPQKLVRRVIGELKTVSAEVPTDRRAAFDETLKRAEDMLAMARSKSAKELGFRIHDCKFPGPLMLWNESQRTHVCEGCGYAVLNMIGLSSGLMKALEISRSDYLEFFQQSHNAVNNS